DMDEQHQSQNIIGQIRAPEQDMFLEEIARLANLGVGQWITINVSGVNVCGRTMSGRDYFTRIADQVGRSDFTGNTGDIDFAKILSDNYRDYTRIYDKPEDAGEDWTPPKPGYLHLEMARILTPNGSSIPSSKDLLWRGRLSSIDGFSLAQIEQS
ncbi:hypothetical protein, partial [Methylobacterium sp. WL2]|uniref:hypothetical protein n=1 Tax=Methylobacterium sp. WL2 TaxID=2603902 RepID=UPI00164FA10B